MHRRAQDILRDLNKRPSVVVKLVEPRPAPEVMPCLPLRINSHSLWFLGGAHLGCQTQVLDGFTRAVMSSTEPAVVKAA